MVHGPSLRVDSVLPPVFAICDAGHQQLRRKSLRQDDRSFTLRLLISRFEMTAAQNVRVVNLRSLRSVSLFSALADRIVGELETKLVMSEPRSGSVLYRQNEKTKGVFVLFRGRIRLSALVAGDRTALLKIASAGDVLGLAAVLSSHSQITNAEVLTPSLIGFLRSEDITSAVQNYPEFAQALAHHLAVECMHTTGETLSLRVPSSSAQRLAAMLLRVAESGKRSQTPDDSVGYTHAELGQLIGASRATVTRILRKLERKGFVLSNGSGASDFAILRELADGLESRVS